MLNRQPQSSRAGRANHEPVRSGREKLIRQSCAERFVIAAEIVDADARFRNAGRSARFKDEDRLVGISARHPAAHRSAAQPFVLKKAEPVQSVVPAELAPRVPTHALAALPPKPPPLR